MFGNKIKNRVTKVLNDRIKRPEKEHAEAVVRHNEDFHGAVAQAKAVRDANIEAHADAMVESIIGRV